MHCRSTACRVGDVHLVRLFDEECTNDKADGGDGHGIEQPGKTTKGLNQWREEIRLLGISRRTDVRSGASGSRVVRGRLLRKMALTRATNSRGLNGLVK